MKINITLLAIVFIVIILTIIVSSSMSNAVLTLSLFANFLVIVSNFMKISETMQNMPEPINFTSNEPSNSMYGPFYEIWRNYKEDTPYAQVKPNEYNYANNVDDLITNDTRRRFKDKRTIIGNITKDANYYKYHYGNELDAEERKRWWGNNEI